MLGGEGLADERKLVQKAQKGDVKAFEKIVEDYQGVVYSVAYRYAENTQDAADMAQEVFIKMFKNINSFQEKSKLSTWIYRVATNMCIDIVKKESRNSVAYSFDEGYEDKDGSTLYNGLVDDSMQPDEIVEKREIKDAVNSAISKLSDKYKTVIILRDIEGLHYEEIAEIVDCSVGTVKSRISRGRKNLRKILLDDRELFDMYYV